VAEKEENAPGGGSVTTEKTELSWLDILNGRFMAEENAEKFNLGLSLVVIAIFALLEGQVELKISTERFSTNEVRLCNATLQALSFRRM
jgi:hypothetical protein